MTTIREHLRAQPVLRTERLALSQLGPEHLDVVVAGLADADAMRLTGTRGTFTREQVRVHLAGLPGADDRADFAITGPDGAYLGEVVLNELEDDDRSVNYRIALTGPALRGRGYGTEAGRAVVTWAFDVVGLHRVSLEVYAFNPAAQRSYEKIGFVVEGRAREVLRDGDGWVDAITMGMLASDPRPAQPR
ncbi:GNAT family N-acetyltransferase [Curtobacterium luteum]|uniref:GNAT family N-acetyltransferase n=1 Tax=Curtobacterium luteum TaxID=33881 RepID=UPI0037FC2346